MAKQSGRIARHRTEHNSTTKAREKSRIETGTTHENGRALFDQLVKELTDEEGVTVRRYRDLLLRPDPDRNLLLTTHIIVERILELILETQLPAPGMWIPTADFGSKVRLARALGLIGEEQHRVCSVLNSARNALAHKLEPLDEKWRVELKRLAISRRRKSAANNKSFQETLIDLIAIVFASCLHARFHYKRYQLRERYPDRVHELTMQKVHENLMLPIEKEGDLDTELMNLEIDLQIARESKQSTSKKE